MYLQAHFSKYPNVELKNIINFSLLAFRNESRMTKKCGKITKKRGEFTRILVSVQRHYVIKG